MGVNAADMGSAIDTCCYREDQARRKDVRKLQSDVVLATTKHRCFDHARESQQ